LEPLFQGKTEGDQLFAIFKVLGSPGSEEFSIWEKILVNFDQVLFAEFKDFKPFDLKKLFPGFKDVDNLVDLLRKMFDYIPTRRISASEALKHPFFKEK
jgi:glycogen synthase kinase 3 beta